MKKAVIYTYVVLFLALCALPVVVYPLICPYIDQENYENRLAEEAPKFTVSNIAEFPQKYEAYFNDHAPFRSQSIEANSLINYHLFHQSPVHKVIIGKDGWLFYDPAGGDGDPVADTCGTNFFTPAELETLAADLTAIRNKFQDEGKEFVLLIVPNKASIYGNDFLPDKYEIAKQTTADQFVSYLSENTDLTVVHPKAEFQRAMADNPERPLYYKTDTHWNALGGYLGTKALFDALNIPMPELQELDIRVTDKKQGDLARMMAMTKYLTYDDLYSVNGYPGDADYQVEYPLENSDLIVHSTATDKDTRSAFILHDSFGTSIVPYLSSQFNDCYCVHVNAYTPAYLAEVDPDVVVVEVAERYIDSLFSLEM